MLTTALRLTRQSISVAPIIPGSKMFDGKAMSDRGCTLKDLKSNLPSVDDLEFWFSSGNRRLAIICQDVICLDFDNASFCKRFKEAYPAFGHTWTVKSPRGYHLYYQVKSTDIGNLKCTWPMTEIKYGGKAIITAGQGYQDVDNGLLNIFAMMELRDALVLPVVKEGEPFSFVEKSNEAEGEAQGAERLKSNTLTIPQYLKSLGHTLIETPAGYITKCPLHEDKHPSFWIDTSYNNCNCYTPNCASDKAMDIFNLYARINDVPNAKAIKTLSGSKSKAKRTTKTERKMKRDQKEIERLMGMVK